jgi:hypothetical protein
MRISSKLQKDLQNEAKIRDSIKMQVDREIEKSIDEYRLWMAKEIDEGRKPLSILAEGDSWFNYSLAGSDIIDFLEKNLNIRINNLASPGDEVKEMLTGEQKERLERELKRGPHTSNRRKYDVLLFSGGGNDLVGVDRFYKWLHDYKSGMTAKQVINKNTLSAAFGLLSVGYSELIKIRNVHSPATKIVFHGYDFAIPNGKGVCFQGPWLLPGLKQRKVPKKLHRDVVKEFLKSFNHFLLELKKNNKNIVVVPTQGVLADNEWANEIHPTNKGFDKISRLFEGEVT